MSIIRSILGALILFFDWLTSPRGVRRNPAEQARVDREMAGLTLYEYRACPFCVKVRRAAKRRSLNLATRDAKRCERAREELLAGGGQLKVPCLKIEEQGEVRWLYESADIVDFLEQRAAA